MGNLLVGPEKPNLFAYLNAHPENKANGGGTFYLVTLPRKLRKI